MISRNTIGSAGHKVVAVKPYSERRLCILCSTIQSVPVLHLFRFHSPMSHLSLSTGERLLVAVICSDVEPNTVARIRKDQLRKAIPRTRGELLPEVCVHLSSSVYKVGRQDCFICLSC